MLQEPLNPELQQVSVGTLFKKAAWARNNCLTYGGRAPLEIAFGRRPPDIIQLENMDPAQWTTKDARAGRIDLLLREKQLRHTWKLDNERTYSWTCPAD